MLGGFTVCQRLGEWTIDGTRRTVNESLEGAAESGLFAVVLERGGEKAYHGLRV